MKAALVHTGATPEPIAMPEDEVRRAPRIDAARAIADRADAFQGKGCAR